MKSRQINKKLVTMISTIAIAAITVALFTNSSVQTQQSNYITSEQTAKTTASNVQYMGAAPINGSRALPAPPEPFMVKINGSIEPTTITVKRGGSAQVDVVVNPKIVGIAGDLVTLSGFPTCGSKGAEIVKNCNPSGIILSLSDTTIKQGGGHATLTISVADNVQPGIYPYSVSADTTLNVPYQAEPVRVGYQAVFAVGVS